MTTPKTQPSGTPITPTMKKWLRHIKRGGQFSYMGRRMSLVHTGDTSVTLPTVYRMEEAGLIEWRERDDGKAFPTHDAVLTPAGEAAAA